MAQTTTTATRGARGVLPASGTTILAGMIALLVSMAPGQVAAASNALSAGKAMPSAGTTETGFTLSVVYVSPHGFPASRVVALVADQAVEMTLFSGRADDGVWEATTRLPAGSWPLTFQATASQGKSPMLDGPTIVVTSAPGPAAQPTSPPQPPGAPPQPAAPEPLPALTGSTTDNVAPPSTAPAVLDVPPSAGATDVAGVQVGTAGGELLPTPAAEGLEGGLPWMPMLAALAAIAGVAWGSRFVGVARRRRGGGASAPAAPTTRAVAAAARPARRIADWELASLDDEPIGTVDYTGLRPLA